ncbi:hypothetical protein LOK49_LG12G02705 [Camellia lanceoleosa]|uniref:Uncharacterized protein n=1 Tax=Camellia lanceoleosa TaxID=1840588 RepID=A0ACC0FVL9_9ERIC|nr:hypothetical protein LOK49_LG12G02705 [Camellia lanceoleosa]
MKVGEATVKKQRPTIQYNTIQYHHHHHRHHHLLLSDMNETSTRNEVVESAQTEAKLKDDPKQHRGSLEATVKTDIGDCKGVANVSQDAVQADKNASGEVNMEASISSDDVIRAGGFGARDGIGSFLPVASDSTDFEASLRDARDYEDPQEEICRPGLGFTKATK